MVPYYGRHSCKQYIQNKPVKFGYKIWAAAITLGYAVQFYPYAGKDSSYNKDIGLGGSVIMNLVSKLPKVPDSNYHIVMNNFFTSPRLLRLLKENVIAATGTLRANRTENAPLIAIDEMKKGSRGISDVVNDNKYNVTHVRWKDNKVVTVASTLYGKEPMKRASRYIKDKDRRVYIDPTNAISVYNRHMGGVDRLDQNICNYKINLRNKKWWLPLFRYCVDISTLSITNS
ncbi:piggyBac transposable element-derived protein 3-like [Lepeophtheirus salmonis]|uniref:piggyBac transposable element-derived protein 3-like n=1 Tax=Lepeophtheirus salmonis TaxID=72036 RepID=UPI001AE3CE4F|nr:piggyBac transposable element-derived protein 3-like [Lepeophtheirus salmonis]